MKRFNADICLLQETHCNKDSEKIWSSEWGNRCIFANGCSNSKGVAFLLNRKTSQAVQEIVRDTEGRLVIIKLTFNGLPYCIANIYAPNNNDVQFFGEFFEAVNKIECVHTVLGGDFNVVMNSKIDRNCDKLYNQANWVLIQKAVTDMELRDIWREQHPDKKTLLWMRGPSHDSWSRIDYFLVSDSLANLCMDSDIVPSVQTDHSMITVSIEINENKRGHGLWKLNNSLLNDEAFCEEIKTSITNIKHCYEHVNPLDKWELIKFESSLKAKEFSEKKAFQNKNT